MQLTPSNLKQADFGLTHCNLGAEMVFGREYRTCAQQDDTKLFIFADVR